MSEPTNNLTLLEASVSVDKAVADLAHLGTAVDKMGNAFINAGNAATQGADKTDAAASKAAIAAGRSAAAAASNLAREIAALKAGGRATADYYDQIYAKQAQTNPLIAKQITELRGLQDAAKAAAAEQKRLADAAREAAAAASLAPATQQMEKLGMSAKATAAALRQVPAQFTDIVVSLQGGQAPLTVLLQQGGQLKDVFGGVGPAFKALAGYVIGLINPFTLAAAAIGAIGLAWHSGAAESEAFNKALILTGNYAGLTTTKLLALQSTVAAATGGTKGAAAEALAAFAASGQLAGTNYEKFAQVAVRAQKELGVAVGDTVKLFEDLGKEPLKASLKLNESTNFLTLSVYKQIKALEDQGKTAEAAALAQNSYADVTNQRLAKVTENLGYMESALRAVSKGWAILWDTAKGVGRDADPVAQLRERLNAAEGALSGSKSRGDGGDTVTRRQALVQSLQEQLMLREKGAGYEAQSVAYQAASAKQVKAQIAADEIHDKYLTNKVKLERELTKTRKVFAEADIGADPATIAENARKLAVSEAKIRDQFKDPKGPKQPDGFAQEQGKAYAKYIEDSNKAKLAAKVQTDSLTKSEGALLEMQADPVFQSMPETWKETALQSKYAAIAAEKNADAAKIAAKYTKDETDAAKESAKAIAKKLVALEDENKAYVIAEEKNISLAEAIDLVAIARLKDQRLLIQGTTGNKDAIAAIEQEIADRERLAASLGGRTKHLSEIAANKEATRAAVEEWRRGWDNINNFAHDAFASWIDGGENAAKKMGDAIKKYVVNTLYDLTLRPIAMQIYTGTVGGMPTAASVAGSAAGGGVAQAGSLAALGSTFGSSLSAGFGATVSSFGAATGVAIEGGLASIATGTSTAIASGLGQIAGALGPYALAAVALYYLFKKGEYVQSTGSSVMAFDATGATTSKSALSNNFVTAEADKYVAGIKDAYTSLIKQFGGTNPGGSFAFASNNSDGGKFGVQVGVGTAGYSTGELKASPEALTLEASRAVFAALQGSELPKYLAGVFDSLTATTATQDQINQALAYANSIKAIHDQLALLPFAALRDLSLKATESLATFSGGLANLGTNLGTYYDKFYSVEEKRVQTIANITAALNAAGAGIDVQQVTDVLAQPAEVAIKTFRALVDAQDLATEAGQKNYATLLTVSGAFAGLTVEAKAAATAVDTAATAINEAWANEGRRIDAARSVIDSLRAEATSNYIAAQQRVVAAQQGVAQALQQTIGSFKDFLATLDNAAKPTERLASARQNFNDLNARAQGGDLAAVNQLPGAAKSFLDLSKGYSASITDYRRDEAKVRIALNAGIAAGQAQLAKLPADIVRATDPLVAAYQELELATKAEFDARTLAIAMQARLSTAESDLADRYIKATQDLGSDGQVMRDFFNNAKATVAAALKISLAAAEAAQAMLAQLYNSGATPQADKPTITATTGTSTVLNPVQQAANDSAGKPQTISLNPAVDPTLHGVGGIAMFNNGDMALGGGASLAASDAISILNDYAASLGKDAALARWVELGGTPAMLDRLRTIAGPTASFDKGINYLPSDMVIQAHKGERIMPAADNSILMETLRSPRANNDVLVQAVKDLQAEVASLRAEAEARDMVLIGAAQKTAKINFKWDQDGLPATRTRA